MNTLNVTPSQMVSFASQLLFLWEVCDRCLIGVEGCGGCIEKCPHSHAWPEETVTYIGDEGDTAKLEGFAWPHEGKMPGYVRVYDHEGNKKQQQPVVITLPQTH